VKTDKFTAFFSIETLVFLCVTPGGTYTFVGLGVDTGVGVGVTVGKCVGVEVGVGVVEGSGVKLAVGEGLGVFVGSGLGEEVGVGVGLPEDVTVIIAASPPGAKSLDGSSTTRTLAVYGVGRAEYV